MSTATNITFTILIKVNGRLREFNFRKRTDVLFDVDTNNEQDNRFRFQLAKEDAGWKIIGTKLPQWVNGYDAVISDALNKELNG